MPSLRTIKREWKPLLAGAFGLAMVACFSNKLHSAWSYGDVYAPPLVPSAYNLYCVLLARAECPGRLSTWISYTAHPHLFLGSLALWTIVTIVLAALTVLIFWGCVVEARNLKRREMQPPFDNAIRMSADGSAVDAPKRY
jgi:hypothetical protein